MDKIVLNKAGIAQLLKSQELMSECTSVAQSIASSDSGRNAITTRVGRSRVCAEIKLTGHHAAERSDRLT